MNLPNDCLSAKMMRLSDQMIDLAKEIDGKYHLNAVELAGAAMLMADWAMEVSKEEALLKESSSIANIKDRTFPELSIYDE